jgi:hypothetical protein
VQFIRSLFATNVPTSVGEIPLRRSEVVTLARLKNGELAPDEALAFYAQISQRTSKFPMEWERHVLKVNLLSTPDRPDLLRRLATVELALADGSDLDLALRYEQRWLELQNVDLLSCPVRDGGFTHRRRAIELAVSVLLSPCFFQRDCVEMTAMIQQIHDTFMSSPGDDLTVIAEAGLQVLSQLFSRSELELPQACSWYDCIHSLFFASVQDVRELCRFDRIAVPLFEDWLSSRSEPRPLRVWASSGRVSIAYLLHVAHSERGNAVSPLITSLVEAHSRLGPSRVFLYTVQHVTADFLDAMKSRDVVVRNFSMENHYDRLDVLEHSLAQDCIDVIISEQNRAIASYLFARRNATCQMWLDTGFPFWRLQSLDWTLSPVLREQLQQQQRISRIRWGQSRDTLIHSSDRSEIRRLRLAFPPSCFLLGVIARLVKLDRHFLSVLERLLRTDPSLHLLIAGPGDASHVETFIATSGLADRMTLIKGMVDLNVYACVIDVLCDTFPFIGGNACREVAVHGTPVVSRLGTPWDSVLLADRSPDLLATTDDGYIDLVRRLASDSAFRQEQRAFVLAKSAQYEDVAASVEDVELAIRSFRSQPS